MAQKAAELGALAVQRLNEPGLHFVGGVAGLALQVKATASRSWILRATVGGKRRDIGLGGFPDVTLAQAREKARALREQVRQGIDPVAERRAAIGRLKAEQAAAMTFEKAARTYVEAHEASWRNPKHAQQWRSTLEQYAYPVMGSALLRDIELRHVMAVLSPIWQEKTETASRLRGRIERVLDWATVCGHREGLNPARWKGHLDKLLARPAKIAKIEHHAALPVTEVGDFMARLCKAEGVGARALEFTILTAARSGEVRGATWSEIDLDEAVWTVPAERMKAGREHRVPLTPSAVALLKALPRMAGTDHVFVAARGGRLSDMTLTAVLRRMGVDAVPHGFRSTFRDWAAECTNHAREVAEMALAHTIENKVEAAYRRGDLFTKRRRLMEDWAAFCAAGPKARLVRLERRRAR
jgi:integrase